MGYRPLSVNGSMPKDGDITPTTKSNNLTKTVFPNLKNKSYSLHLILTVSAALLLIIFVTILVFNWRKKRQYIQ